MTIAYNNIDNNIYMYVLSGMASSYGYYKINLSKKYSILY